MGELKRQIYLLQTCVSQQIIIILKELCQNNNSLTEAAQNIVFETNFLFKFIGKIDIFMFNLSKSTSLICNSDLL